MSFWNLFAKQPEDEDYFQSLYQPLQQSKSGIGPSVFTQELLDRGRTIEPVPSHVVPQTSGPMGPTKIGPETNPTTKLDLFAKNPINPSYSEDTDVDKMNSVMQQYMNQRLRSPDALADAPFGVTTFGVGPSEIAARKAATEKVMRQIEDLIWTHSIPAGQADQMRQVARDYPRVMAHQSIFDMGATMHGGEPGMRGVASPDVVPGRSQIFLNTMDENKGDLARAFVHELTHGAQGVSLKDLTFPIREAAEQQMKSLRDLFGRRVLDDYQVYRNLPDEVGAYNSMNRRAKPEPNWFDYMNEPPRNTSVTGTGSFWDQLNKLQVRVPGRNY
jgi:hypothetical protein